MVETPYWQVTADLFGKLIDKPKMTEKHLSKPPPLYVFDIIVNTMKATGFPNGLYTDSELDPKNFNADKNNRLDFLQKAVDMTKLVLNGPIDVKVKNILAGEESEKTNLFLQSFHKAATMQGVNFPKLIKKYLDLKKKKDEEKKGGDEKKAEPEKPAAKPVAKPAEQPKEDDKVKKQRPETPKKQEPKQPEKVVASQQPVPAPEPVAPKPKKEEKKEEPKKKVEVAEKDKDRDDEKDLRIDNQGTKIKMSGTLGNKAKQIAVDGEVKKTTVNLKDLEGIKSYIHDISSNANPIGKLLDYLPEDIESMNKELQFWITEASKYNDKYEEELKKSEEILFPLEKEYLELVDTIKDEEMRIKSIKSRILKNELIIQNLINGVISVSSAS